MSKDALSMIRFILGKDNKTVKKEEINLQKVNRQLIMSSGMFWDSKKGVQKIKTLFLNYLGLQQFGDTEDFKVQQLLNIELLSLSKNSIIHLHPIRNLNTLLSLNISFNRVYDLNPLIGLLKLQELYASNNQIKTIDALGNLKDLKVLILYQNLIHNFRQTFQTIQCLKNLNEIDFQANPVGADKQFVELVMQSFQNIRKLNSELTKSTQKIKQMTSSKGFMMNTSTKGFGTTSMLFHANCSKLSDPQKTLYDFCKKRSSNSRSYQKRKQKQNILSKLQRYYQELDEEFEREIIKNVRLKNRLYQMMSNKKWIQAQQEDNSQKGEQLKQLKRKVKNMKQQLFSKDKKGDLLRKLFQIQLVSKNTEEHQKVELQSSLLPLQSQFEKLQIAINQVKWTRKFEADEVILIQKRQKYVPDEDEEINSILGNFQLTIQEIKSDLQYLS